MTKFQSQLSVAVLASSLLGAMLGTSCSHSGSGPRTTAATATIKGQFIDARHLTDAGNTTPEATLETIFWAESKGDRDAELSCSTPKMQEVAKGSFRSKKEFSSFEKKRFLRFQGLQIVARKDLADGTVQLRYQFDFNDHLPAPKTGPLDKVISMVNIQGAWKCAAVTGYTTDWDAGSTPEPR